MTQAARYLKFNTILFAIAAAIAGYLVWHHYAVLSGEAGFGSFCSINNTLDCDAVNASSYSEFLGIPLGMWGLGYYLFALLVSFIGWKNAFSRRDAVLLLFPLAILSIIASMATIGIMAFALKNYCVMCLSLDALNLITAAFVIMALRDVTSGSTFMEEWRQKNPRRILTLAGTGAAIFLVVHLMTSQLTPQIPFDREMFLHDFHSQPVHDVIPGDSPRQGFQGDNPPVRLVEFADFQCPGCAMAAKLMHHLVKAYDDKIQLVFKHYPLDSSCNPNIPRRMHEHACLAAKAAICAQKSGKFTEYYERLFARQAEISPNSIVKWASELGMEEPEFTSCLESPETAAQLQRDISQANSLGLASTPTFFVNGRKVEGAIDENRLKAILKALDK